VRRLGVRVSGADQYAGGLDGLDEVGRRCRPDADLDDAAGSNLPGIAPPNGIPLTTISDGTNSATGYAEILPNRIRTYILSLSPAS
jgi:hypothetical protein